MSKERFTYIDGLRGIAIAGVIITHAASITDLGGKLKGIFGLGGFGVQLFFVISAFTIFYSLSKTNDNLNRYRDFYIRRLFRIIPIYWIGIALYTIVYGLGSRGWRDGPELWHYPYHIFLVNTFHPLTSSSVVPGGWSISCEIMFYLLVPILYKSTGSNKRIFYFMLLSLVVLPFANNILKQSSVHTFFKYYDPIEVKNFFYRWIPSQLACFGFGMILFKIYTEGSYKSYISNRYINLISVTLATALLLVLNRVNLLFEVHHLYAFVFMILALLLSVYPWKLYVNKFTVFLGKISYSGYLIHFLVLKQATLAAEKFTPQLLKNDILYFCVIALVGFAITIPLAYLSYKFIELSAVALGRNLLNRLNHKIPSV